jgi:hypothetical protein
MERVTPEGCSLTTSFSCNAIPSRESCPSVGCQSSEFSSWFVIYMPCSCNITLHSLQSHLCRCVQSLNGGGGGVEPQIPLVPPLLFINAMQTLKIAVLFDVRGVSNNITKSVGQVISGICNRFVRQNKRGQGVRSYRPM